MPAVQEKAKPKKPVPLILVNEEWCKRCGICIEYCPTKVFVPEDDGLPLVENAEACIWCDLCVLRCPDFAIILREKDQNAGDGPKGGKDRE